MGQKKMTVMNQANRTMNGVSPSHEKDLSPRTWFFFYLICLVALLWATFLLVRNEFIWVSMFLVIVSIGISIFVYFLVDPYPKPGSTMIRTQEMLPEDEIVEPENQTKSGKQDGPL